MEVVVPSIETVTNDLIDHGKRPDRWVGLIEDVALDIVNAYKYWQTLETDLEALEDQLLSRGEPVASNLAIQALNQGIERARNSITGLESVWDIGPYW